MMVEDHHPFQNQDALYMEEERNIITISLNVSNVLLINERSFFLSFFPLGFSLSRSISRLRDKWIDTRKHRDLIDKSKLGGSGNVDR